MKTFKELPNGTVHIGFADAEPGDRVIVQTASGTRKIVTLGELASDDANGNIFKIDVGMR